MATSRNRLLEVSLFAEVHHNLIGSVIVAQHGDMLIVKRPESKPRQKSAAPRKPRAAKTNAKGAAATTTNEVSANA